MIFLGLCDESRLISNWRKTYRNIELCYSWACATTRVLFLIGENPDQAALKPYFGKNVLIVTGSALILLGTLQPVPNSQKAVTMTPLPDDVAEKYPFAINGVALLSADSISFLQNLK